MSVGSQTLSAAEEFIRAVESIGNLYDDPQNTMPVGRFALESEDSGKMMLTKNAQTLKVSMVCGLGLIFDKLLQENPPKDDVTLERLRRAITEADELDAMCGSCCPTGDFFSKKLNIQIN